jgi:hypothetical protein
MRPEDRTRILHMIEAAETVQEFVGNRARGDLDSDRILLFALMRAIEVLGGSGGQGIAGNARHDKGHTLGENCVDAKPADTCLFRYRSHHSVEDGN